MSNTMMSNSQAILVKSLGATDTKPARLRVVTSGGAFSATYSRHEFDDQPHAGAAAKFLAALPESWNRMSWRGAFINNDTCAFIATPVKE